MKILGTRAPEAEGVSFLRTVAGLRLGQRLRGRRAGGRAPVFIVRLHGLVVAGGPEKERVSVMNHADCLIVIIVVFVELDVLSVIVIVVIFVRSILTLARLHDEPQVHPGVDGVLVEAHERHGVAPVHEAILVGRRSVNNLDLPHIHEDAAGHRRGTLAVVLARGEYGEDPRALAERDAIGVRLVCANDVAVPRVPQEVIDGLAPKANGAAAAHRRAEAVIVESRLLVVARRVRPEAVRCHALSARGLVRVRWRDAGNDGHHEHALQARGTARSRHRQRRPRRGKAGMQRLRQHAAGRLPRLARRADAAAAGVAARPPEAQAEQLLRVGRRPRLHPARRPRQVDGPR
mmetsp:Transcript_21873/g.67104  ORF Transcript_21873/g.67104 Transcript_21873/m.67104 type:complete len:347 (+) Transcript_21873:1183-2223(+)